MAFTPTHAVPRTAGGIATWPEPDPTAAEGPRLDAGLPVSVVVAQADGWTQIECENGWRAWVDGRLLQPMSTMRPPNAPTLSREELRAPVKIGPVSLTTPLIGGALVLVGALLPWVSQGPISENGLGIPIKVLFDPKSQNAGGGFKLGFVLILLGALTIAAGLGRLPIQVGKAAGGAAMLLATVFLGQLQRAIGQVQAASVFGVLGMGVYLTMLGGVLAAMAKPNTRSALS
jgi:hypothetical protein